MPNADEEALRAIRAASTALQEWTRYDGKKAWPEGESPRSWKGVTWSGDRVQELDFEGSGMEVLAPQIGQLTALTKVNLGYCPLKKLPPQIGQLTALTYLSLFNCKQLKELPPQIGQLTALTNLNLGGCTQLKELPPQIGQLTALTNLNLGGCAQLKELPPQIGQLTALTNLCLDGCAQLKELPPQIGQLTALTDLSVQCCEQLKELPPQIGQLTSLTDLTLFGCKQLKELPPQIGQLLALTNLNLGGCQQLTLAPGAEGWQPVQTILAAYAPLLIAAPHKDAPGELHAFLLANPLAVPAFFTNILTDAAHATWLGEAVKATPDLAKLTDADGRRAVDAAHPACKQAMQGDVGPSTANQHTGLQDGDVFKTYKEMRHMKLENTPEINWEINWTFSDSEDAGGEGGGEGGGGEGGGGEGGGGGGGEGSGSSAKYPDYKVSEMPNADEVALRAIRAASTALQEWWPESPRSWRGVKWSGDRVQELDLKGSGLEVLAPQIGQLTALTKLSLAGCPLKELPPQIGQLTALTDLDLHGCKQLKELPPQMGQLLALTNLNLDRDDQQLSLAPGVLYEATTIVANYAPLLIVEPLKDTPGELLAFLRANPLSVPPFFKTILTAAAHAAWLSEAVSATPELAKFTDDIGRRAVDVAHPACKRAMQAALFLLGRFDVDDGKLLHRSATAAVAAAADHGDPEAKPVPRVALKAMREVAQMCAELKGRAGLDFKYVIAIKAVYADEEAVDADAWETVERAAAGLQGVELQRVPGLSRSIQANLFPSKKVMDQAPADAAAGARPSAPTLDASSEYKFLIVLELADRNLKHTIDHEHITGEDWPAIRHIASHLGRALDHVHAEGGIHADLKPLNAVGDGETWKIIDFDVFCKVGEPFGNKVPSSGYCPPEMAKVLLAATDQETGKVDASLLQEYVASEAYDLWSLGVVLYYLCFGMPLWKTDINDNVDLEVLQLLASVADEPLRVALNKALNRVRKNASADDLKTATALLRKLLEPDPSKRLKHFEDFDRPMEAVLKEPFFQGKDLDAATLKEIKEKQEEMQREQEKQTALVLTAIKELGAENKTELRRTREVLMKGIFEATEVSQPTTFIVLNEKLPEPTTEEEEKQLIQIAKDGSGVAVTHELGSMTFTEDGPRVEAKGKYKEYVDKFNTGMKWVHRLKTIGSNVAAGKVGDAFETIKKGLGDLVTGDTMYLYLVDELTCEPVRAEGYPIKITTPSEIVPKLLPLMQVGLRAMSIYNGAGGIARLFGYPVPKVPEAWATGARESVELLKQESSVAQFGVVHEEAMEGSEESKSVRGHSLRVFTDFLQKNDPGLRAGKSGDFAGLQRIGDPNDGTALWTTLTDPQAIKRALEARTREREAELRVGNKYIQAQAAGGLAPQTTPVRESENENAERAVGCCKWWPQTTGRTNRSRAN